MVNHSNRKLARLVFQGPTGAILRGHTELAILKVEAPKPRKWVHEATLMMQGLDCGNNEYRHRWHFTDVDKDPLFLFLAEQLGDKDYHFALAVASYLNSRVSEVHDRYLTDELAMRDLRDAIALAESERTCEVASL